MKSEKNKPAPILEPAFEFNRWVRYDTLRVSETSFKAPACFRDSLTKTG